MIVMSFGAIVLAAGPSKRLGRPKQLVEYHGVTLLRRALETAIDSPCDPVVVVLGYEGERMRAELGGLPVTVVENEAWTSGMGSSISAGVAHLATSTKAEGAVILVCDQIKVTPLTIKALIDTQAQDGVPIVASAYGDTVGVPALFMREVFNELLALDSHSGAKAVIEKSPERVALIDFADGAIDIDSPKDLARILGPLRETHTSQPSQVREGATIPPPAPSEAERGDNPTPNPLPKREGAR